MLSCFFLYWRYFTLKTVLFLSLLHRNLFGCAKVQISYFSLFVVNYSQAFTLGNNGRVWLVCLQWIQTKAIYSLSSISNKGAFLNVICYEQGSIQCIVCWGAYANAQKKSQNEKQKRDNTFKSTMVCEIWFRIISDFYDNFKLHCSSIQILTK